MVNFKICFFGLCYDFINFRIFISNTASALPPENQNNHHYSYVKSLWRSSFCICIFFCII